MADKQPIPRKQNDALLKAVFEDNFADFVRFIVPDADMKYDLYRGFEFLDTELRAIIPDRERHGGTRVADLLTKVYLKNGDEAYFLVNTEIEGGSDPDFAMRMYEYNHRIWSKFRRAPVVSIAFYTGGPKQPRPSEFRLEAEGTLIYFRFRTYHILDHGKAELLARKNPFAQVVLACQEGLLEGKASDEELGRARLVIGRALIRHGYDRERTIGLLLFLKNFLYVRDPGINRTFDEEIIQFSGGNISMGIIEVVKEQQRLMGRQEGRQEGWQEGWQEGLAKLEEEKHAYASKLKKTDLSVKEIAGILGLSIDQVERL